MDNKTVGVGLFSRTEERRRHVKGMKRAPERAWFHGPGDDRARAGHGDGRDRLAPRPLVFGSQHAARPSSSASPTDSPGPRPPLWRRRVARWGGPSQRRQGLGGGPGRCRQYQLACPLGRAHADEVFRRSSAAGVGGLVDARRHPADGRTGGRTGRRDGRRGCRHRNGSGGIVSARLAERLPAGATVESLLGPARPATGVARASL